MKIFLLNCLILLILNKVLKTDTPIMGFNTWNKFNMNPTEDAIISVANSIKALKLQDLGYK